MGSSKPHHRDPQPPPGEAKTDRPEDRPPGGWPPQQAVREAGQRRARGVVTHQDVSRPTPRGGGVAGRAHPPQEIKRATADSPDTAGDVSQSPIGGIAASLK